MFILVKREPIPYIEDSVESPLLSYKHDLCYVLDTEDMKVDKFTVDELESIVKDYKINISGFSLNAYKDFLYLKGVSGLLFARSAPIVLGSNESTIYENLINGVACRGYYDFTMLYKNDTLVLDDIEKLTNIKFKSSLQYLIIYFSVMCSISSQYKIYNKQKFLDVIIDLCCNTQVYIDDTIRRLQKSINVLYFNNSYYIYDSCIVLAVPKETIDLALKVNKFNAKSVALKSNMVMESDGTISVLPSKNIRLKSGYNYILPRSHFECDTLVMEDGIVVDLSCVSKLKVDTLKCYDYNIVKYLGDNNFLSTKLIIGSKLMLPASLIKLTLSYNWSLLSKIEIIEEDVSMSILCDDLSDCYSVLSKDDYYSLNLLLDYNDFSKNYTLVTSDVLDSIRYNSSCSLIAMLDEICLDNTVLNIILSDIIGTIRYKEGTLSLSKLYSGQYYINHKIKEKLRGSFDNLKYFDTLSFKPLYKLCKKYNISLVHAFDSIVLEFVNPNIAWLYQDIVLDLPLFSQATLSDFMRLTDCVYILGLLSKVLKYPIDIGYFENVLTIVVSEYDYDKVCSKIKKSCKIPVRIKTVNRFY